MVRSFYLIVFVVLFLGGSSQAQEFRIEQIHVATGGGQSHLRVSDQHEVNEWIPECPPYNSYAQGFHMQRDELSSLITFPLISRNWSEVLDQYGYSSQLSNNVNTTGLKLQGNLFFTSGSRPRQSTQNDFNLQWLNSLRHYLSEPDAPWGLRLSPWSGVDHGQALLRGQFLFPPLIYAGHSVNTSEWSMVQIQAQMCQENHPEGGLQLESSRSNDHLLRFFASREIVERPYLVLRLSFAQSGFWMRQILSEVRFLIRKGSDADLENLRWKIDLEGQLDYGVNESFRSAGYINPDERLRLHRWFLDRSVRSFLDQIPRAQLHPRLVNSIVNQDHQRTDPQRQNQESQRPPVVEVENRNSSSSVLEEEHATVRLPQDACGYTYSAPNGTSVVHRLNASNVVDHSSHIYRPRVIERLIQDIGDGQDDNQAPNISVATELPDLQMRRQVLNDWGMFAQILFPNLGLFPRERRPWSLRANSSIAGIEIPIDYITQGGLGGMGTSFLRVELKRCPINYSYRRAVNSSGLSFCRGRRYVLDFNHSSSDITDFIRAVVIDYCTEGLRPVRRSFAYLGERRDVLPWMNATTLRSELRGLTHGWVTAFFRSLVRNLGTLPNSTLLNRQQELLGRSGTQRADVRQIERERSQLAAIDRSLLGVREGGAGVRLS